MFNLVYNIDFEIVAFLIAILLYVETRFCYPGKSQKDKTFRLLCIMIIITQSFDLISAFSITYADRCPIILNYIISCGYFMSGLFLCYILHYYIEKNIIPEKGKSALLKTNKIILMIMEISVAFNGFFGYYFSFSNSGEYIHGPIFLLMHLVSCYFILCASTALIINRKLLNKKQLASGFSFVFLYFAAVILQTFIFPDVLIIMTAVSGILIIAIFSLESPDYLQLQTTLMELTNTKKELEAANEKYFNLAYSDLMTGLENRTAYNVKIDTLKNTRKNRNIIFMMADINCLKNLNDNFGHSIGDEAIVKTARLIKNNFSLGYNCYRIGGDEFAVIAYDVSLENFTLDYNRFLMQAE